MNLFSGILVFVILWWIILFMVLPWGVQRDENPEKGHEVAAPKHPMMWRKAAVTTVITAVVWGGIYWGVEQGLINFRPY